MDTLKHTHLIADPCTILNLIEAYFFIITALAIREAEGGCDCGGHE